MKSIRYSAPGKVILSGEHVVVYGKPALVCAIDKRLSITFSPAQKTEYKDDIFPVLEQSVELFLKSKKEQIKKTGYTYAIESSIPMGRGLGSSAAYCACVSAGLLELFTGVHGVRMMLISVHTKWRNIFIKTPQGRHINFRYGRSYILSKRVRISQNNK